jgi:RNA polymerase sigma factor (sigma-70 family)
VGEDDAYVIRSILAGNRDDYRILVGRYETAGTRWAKRYVGDPSRVEDIVQEAFVEAYFQLDRLRRPEQFGSWLRSIVNYTAISWLRRRRAALLAKDTVCVMSGYQSYSRYEVSTPHDDLEQQERETALRAAIDGISHDHQQVIAMYYYEGCSYQQIADRRHCSVAAVKSMLHRARQQLKKEMSKHGR